MASLRIALIGAGHMGTALASGWTSARTKFEISLVDPAPSERTLAIAEDANITVNPKPEPADAVIVAVKPQIFQSAAEDIKDWIGEETLVVSIMAGIRIRQLAEKLGTDRVIRAMPNTPGSIGHGITAICAPNGISKPQVTLATKLLKPLGTILGPVPETYMPAITGLSGSGPAYVFLLVEALAGAGEAEGLPADTALQLARETLIGAAKLLEDSPDTPETLRKNVTSKGGTTEAALDILMGAHGIPLLIREAVRAAASRERTLSNEA